MKRADALRAASRSSRLRCVIYTRKSSDEGLDQAFNSLHAQREACEAYVRSQSGEGWTASKAVYDDGGVSGGTMERAALKRLLADVAERRVDVVVVYKVDRLTRSLADFAKIVEIFDTHGVSFVSVTQAFNTTSSMGRLTLNVLLSFAQFEREVTGERIRDKIAASKAKGMWMGGAPPLGYDLPTDQTTRALTVNSAEAERVNHIFRRYLELRSVRELCVELRADGLLSKAWTTKAGRAMGGSVISRGALFYLLSNRVYLGEIRHKQQTYPGRHSPIVDATLFEAAQTQLVHNAQPRRMSAPRGETAPLRGLVVDAQGAPMSPSFSVGRKRDRRYRYYVSSPSPEAAARVEPSVLRRVPAAPLEAVVLDRLSRLMGRAGERDWRSAASILKQVRVERKLVVLALDLAPLAQAGIETAKTLALVQARSIAGDGWDKDPDRLFGARLTIPIQIVTRGGRTTVTAPDGQSLDEKVRPDTVLIKGLRAAHALVSRLSAEPCASVSQLLQIAATKSSYERRLLRLAFLAPDLQAAILEGRQPGGIYLDRLLQSELPLAWTDQRALFADMAAHELSPKIG